MKIIDPRPPSNKNNEHLQRRLVGALARRLRPSADGGHARRRRAPGTLRAGAQRRRRGPVGVVVAVGGTERPRLGRRRPRRGDRAGDGLVALRAALPVVPLRAAGRRRSRRAARRVLGAPGQGSGNSGTIVERLVRFRLIFILMASIFQKKKRPLPPSSSPSPSAMLLLIVAICCTRHGARVDGSGMKRDGASQGGKGR